MKKGAAILKEKPRSAFSPTPGTLAALAFGVFPATVLSQASFDLGTASKFSIVPRVSVMETYTDNVFLASSGKQAELITQVSPGIRISSQGGRITGTLDYSLNELLYANNSSGRRSQNTLNASGTAEAIDNWAFVDFSGVIGQQSVSAFGAPTNDGALLNGNSTETSVFRLAPRVRGRLLGVADYQASYSLTSSQSKSALVSDVVTRDFTGRLSGVGGRLGWTLDANHQVTDFSAGRSTTNQRIGGQLTYALDSRWGVYVKGSHESNNFASIGDRQGNLAAIGASWTPNPEARVNIDRDNQGNTGVVALWAPSKRTSISVTRQRQLFGDTQNVALAYRTPNTAWTFNDSRSVVSTPGQVRTGSASLYDVLYSQFAAGELDPVKREQYDAFLQSNGIKPGATAVGGFLSSSVSLQHQQQLSFAIFGARSTITVIATRSQNTNLDTASPAVADFSISPVIRQNGLTLNYSYRVTPRSVLSVASTRQNSGGSSGQTGTSSRSVNVNLSAQLSRDTSASLGARRVVFDSSTSPYTETAILGNLSVRF